MFSLCVRVRACFLCARIWDENVCALMPHICLMCRLMCADEWNQFLRDFTRDMRAYTHGIKYIHTCIHACIRILRTYVLCIRRYIRITQACMYTYHTYMHIYVSCIHAYIRIIHTCTYTYHTYMHIYVSHKHAYIRITQTCIHTYHAYVHVYVSCTHACIHTYLHTCVFWPQITDLQAPIAHVYIYIYIYIYIYVMYSTYVWHLSC